MLRFSSPACGRECRAERAGWGLAFMGALTPTLSRKRERELTEFASPFAFHRKPMSLFSMSLTEPAVATQREPRPLARYARPVLGVVLPVGLAIAWEIAVRMGLSDGRLVPPPSRIYQEFAELAAAGELQRHFIATVLRVVVGFAVGTVAGTLLGAIAGYSTIVHRLVDPALQGLRAVPSIAWIPLFILWLGIFETSKVALIAVGVFFPIYLGVMGAILSVDRKIVEVGRVFRLSGLAMVRRILLPAVLPAYVVALRVGLGLGWMFVVAAEFMGASEGLGY